MHKKTYRSVTALLLLISCAVATFTLATPFNTPPIFVAPVETEAKAYTESLFVLPVAVEDVDGDELSVQVYNLPDWLTYDPDLHQISGRPERIDKGEYYITIKADDGHLVRSKRVRLEVAYGHTSREHVEGVIKALLAHKLKNLPGVSVALMTPVGELHTFAEGYSDHRKRQPLTVDNRFRVASVTKLMTATLIMRLSEEGYLSLDDHLVDYLPAIARIPYGKEITIRQVLTHTAGIVDHLNHGSFYKGNWEYRKWTDEALISFAARRKARFRPGTAYRYSNTGYCFLGMLIEQVLDQPLAEAYQDWIFAPAGMVQSEYDDYSTRKKRVEYLAANSRSYDYHQSAVGAAGAMISTPADMARFGFALYNGQLVNETSLEEMSANYGTLVGGDNYGLGMRLWDDHGIIHLGHTGSLMGYRSILMYLPEYKATLALTTNHSVYNWYDLVNGVLIATADYYR